MIHTAKGCFLISSYESWRPGAYDSEKTARYAFQFSDGVLQKLQDEANIRNGGFDGVITKKDLDKTRKSIQGQKITKTQALKGLGKPETWAEFSEAAYNEFRKKP